MENPYQTPPAAGQVYVQRTVMTDASGAPVILGEWSERTIVLADGQRSTEVTRILPQTVEGALLIEPRLVYRCASCGAQPLLRVMACGQCGRATCTPCLDPERLLCRPCAHIPWWARLLVILGDLVQWLKPR